MKYITTDKHPQLKEGIVLVKVESTLRVIPMGNFFIGFIFLAVLSIIVVMIKKKKYSIME